MVVGKKVAGVSGVGKLVGGSGLEWARAGSTSDHSSAGNSVYTLREAADRRPYTVSEGGLCASLSLSYRCVSEGGGPND